MANGDLYRCAFGYTVHGQSNVNVFYMRQSASGGGDDAQDAAQIISPILRDLYTPVVAGLRGAVTTLQTQLVARLSTDGGEFTSSFPSDGANIGGALPPANAVVIRLRTGFAGRRRRGRIFLGGVLGTWQTAGNVNSTGAAVYATFMQGLLTNFGGATPVTGYTLGVFSRASYSLLGNPFDDYWKPVTALQQPPAVATMRSRKVGVGA